MTTDDTAAPLGSTSRSHREALTQARKHVREAQGCALSLLTLTRTYFDAQLIGELTNALTGLSESLGVLDPQASGLAAQVARIVDDNSDAPSELERAARQVAATFARLTELGDAVTPSEVEAAGVVIASSANDALRVLMPLTYVAGELDGLSCAAVSPSPRADSTAPGR